MKKIFTLFLLSFFTAFLFNAANAQTVYATLASGNWSDAATWETYNTFAAALAAAPGSGTAATTVPSGTHNVVIRNGHTISMNGANRGCKGIIINAGGKLWANEATDRRLQIGAGGTGFTYPLVDTVQVDGTLGGPSDGCYIEVGTNAQLVKIWGTGTVDLSRFRCPGGNSGGTMTIDVDINMNFWKSANYAISLVYNPAATDVYTMNIKPGRTVATKSVDGYFHNSQNLGTYGKYTYNIQGTLDLSANTQTANNLSTTLIAPAGTGSALTVNVDGGTFKAGAGVKMDTSTTGPVSSGVLDFNVTNGGIVDLSATTYLRVGKTTNGAGGANDVFFGVDATSSVKRNVDATDTRFYIGINTATSMNNCRIANSGTPDVHTVKLKSTFDNAPADPNKVVNRQWTIAEAVAGGSVDTLRLGWVVADQAAGFDPASTIYIMRWTGSAWEYLPASISGTGTIDDPYQAKAVTTNVGIFGVTTFTPVPMKLLSFNGAVRNGRANLSWATANQQNASHFVVEESKDGVRYNAIGSVNATENSAVNNYSFVNTSVLVGQSYFRIKMMDKDGQYQYSNVIVLKNNTKNNLTVASALVADRNVNLLMNDLSAGTYQVVFVNAAGQIVQKNTVGHAGGYFNNNIVLNGTLNSGVYFVRMTGNGIQQQTEILVK